jgi:hypothetical protein
MEPLPSVPALPPPAESPASLAEDLPELYRTILERVAALEHVGQRDEAGRIRTAATRAYSRAWDEAAHRLLLGLLGRADRALTTPTQARTWTIRRRIAAAR